MSDGLSTVLVCGAPILVVSIVVATVIWLVRRRRTWNTDWEKEYAEQTGDDYSWGLGSDLDPTTANDAPQTRSEVHVETYDNRGAVGGTGQASRWPNSGRLLRALGVALALAIFIYNLAGGSCETAVVNESGDVATLAHSTWSTAAAAGLIVLGVVIDNIMARVRQSKRGPGRKGLLMYLIGWAIAGAYVGFWLMSPVYLLFPCAVQAVVGIFGGGVLGFAAGFLTMLGLSRIKDFTVITILPVLIVLSTLFLPF